MKNLLIPLAISLFLAGCANVNQQRDDLEKIGACCTSPANAPVTEMHATPQVIRMGNTDPIGEFADGKSRYKLLSLPPAVGSAQRTIRLSARTQTLKVFSGGGSWEPYFHPAVTFFDSSRNAISSTIASEDPTVDLCCVLTHYA